AVKYATASRCQTLIEHQGRFDPNAAITIAKKLGEFDPLFMEEPVHPDNLEGLRKYREATDVRVALGERILTKEQAAFVLANDLTDYLQTDTTHIAWGQRAEGHEYFSPDEPVWVVKDTWKD